MARIKGNAIDYKEVLKNKKVPILTLDQKWHELFPEHEKTSAIRNLEKKLNQLMKKQGKCVNDIKDMKKLKAILLENIVANMDSGDGAVDKLAVKKQDKNQQLVKDINGKIKDIEEELLDLPYEIKEVNQELLVESMKVCYSRLENNQAQIQQIGVWIEKMRTELKEKILVKQDMEMKNTEVYSYMHQLLGPEVTELFDYNLQKKEGNVGDNV